MGNRDSKQAEIDWVIFDLGAVLIDWNPRYAFRKMQLELGAAPTDVEAKIDTFIREVATSEWNAQMDSGVSFQDAIDRRAREFPEWKKWLQMWRDEWPSMMREAMTDSVAIFKEVVRQREAGRLKGVLALSNWEAGTFKIAKARFPFLAEFDARLISGEERLIKPDPRFFRLLESRHGVTPGRAIFVDDLTKNTQVAEDLGYQIHLFENASQLRADFEARNILENCVKDGRTSN